MNKTIQLHIKKSGLHTSFQDGGRKGHTAFGIPIGGAMDQAAFHAANQLVGNVADTPVLEITLLGPTIEFSDAAQIAITGAHLSPKLNQVEIPMYETFHVEKGSVLSFGKIQHGCRAYLAVGGKWKIKNWLGSYSALKFDDRIQNGDLITIQTHNFIEKRKEENPYSTLGNSVANIRVMEGPEFNYFSRKNIASFFSKKYKISAESNRMGYQIHPQIIDYQSVGELISSGIVPGTIQVTNAGQPIILMRDAQTTGGYPRIANVISEDIDVLAQLKPGDELRFDLVELRN